MHITFKVWMEQNNVNQNDKSAIAAATRTYYETVPFCTFVNEMKENPDAAKLSGISEKELEDAERAEELKKEFKKSKDAKKKGKKPGGKKSDKKSE